MKNINVIIGFKGKRRFLRVGARDGASAAILALSTLYGAQWANVAIGAEYIVDNGPMGTVGDGTLGEEIDAAWLAND